LQTTELALDAIVGGDNPRQDLDLTEDFVASIKTHGVLEPIRVVDVGNGMFRIESGHRRYNASLAAELKTIPAIVTGNGDTPADDEFVRAIVTNVQRADLTPVDEARAFLKLITEHGLTPQGVSERVGVSQKRVTERMELLEFPPRIIDLFHEGALQPRVRVNLRAMARVSSGLAIAAAELVASEDNVNAANAVLATDPLRVVRALARSASPFAISAWQVTADDLKGAKVPKKVRDELVAAVLKIEDWRTELEWAQVRISLAEADVDAARAAGVLYEVEDSAPRDRFITDRDWLVAYLPTIASRIVADFEEREQRAKEERRQTKAKVDAAADPQAAWEQERTKATRRLEAEAKDKALAHNDALGAWLFAELPAPVAGDMDDDVAALLVRGTLHTNAGAWFSSGIGLCLPQFRTVEGEGDKAKVTYVTTQAEATERLGEWLGQAGHGGELVRRALIVVLAAKLADTSVLPAAKRPFAPSLGTYGSDKAPWGVPMGQLVKQVPAQLRPKALPSAKHVKAGLTRWEKDNPAPEPKA
jgi:ParB/RepB/Spo0J family partition protein